MEFYNLGKAFALAIASPSSYASCPAVQLNCIKESCSSYGTLSHYYYCTVWSSGNYDINYSTFLLVSLILPICFNAILFSLRGCCCATVVKNASSLLYTVPTVIISLGLNAPHGTCYINNLFYVG